MDPEAVWKHFHFHSYSQRSQVCGSHEAKILQRDPNIGTGAGHHSVVKGPGEDEWYIIYHRHPLGETDGNARVTCVDRMYFDKDGKIKPIKMTFEGVKASPLK